MKDLYLSINCIPVDCQDMSRCRCNKNTGCADDPQAHFEVPQILLDYGVSSIDYIGTADRQFPFVVYTSSYALRQHKYRKRGTHKPYVWIDTTPNKDGMYDCFVFNAPLLKTVSVTAVFKDVRQLDKYSCCADLADDNFSFTDAEVVKRVTEKLIRYYRQLAMPLSPNNQAYTQG